jgi:hypothetical protein
MSKWKAELERFLASRAERRAWSNYAERNPEQTEALMLAWADAKLPPELVAEFIAEIQED